MVLLGLLSVCLIGCGGGGGGGDDGNEITSETVIFRDIFLPDEDSTQYFSCEYESQPYEYERIISRCSYMGYVDKPVICVSLYYNNTLTNTDFYDFDADGNFLYYGAFNYDTIGGDSEFRLPIPQPVVVLPKIVDINKTYRTVFIEEDYELDVNPDEKSDEDELTIEISFHKETINVPAGTYDTYVMTVITTSVDSDSSEIGEEVEMYYLVEGIGAVKFEEDDINICELDEFPYPQLGLVAYYPFNGNAYDESGNGYDGTPSGELLYQDGLFGKALYLDGDNDYIEVNIPLDGTANWSICSFININDASTSQWQNLVSNKDEGFLVGFKTDDRTYRMYDAPETLIQSENNAVEQGVDTAICYVKDSDILKVYKDEELIAENNNGDLVNFTKLSKIGIWDNEGTLNHREPWNGLLDELLIYNRALSGAEIQALYTTP